MEEKITITKEEFLEKEAEVCAKLSAMLLKSGKVSPLSPKFMFVRELLADFAALLVIELFDNNSQDDENKHDCENCEFKDICEAPSKDEYKARLGKEYWELTSKHNKLTEFIANVEKSNSKYFKDKIVLLKEQEHEMYEYLQTLQKRADAENIDLKQYKPHKPIGGRK